MSTEKVEVMPDNTNVSLEEQAKQQTVNATTTTDERVEVSAVDEAQKSTEEQRPEWLPEKFANAEDLAKAYGELEKRMSAPKEEEVAENTPEQQQVGSMDKYYNEYAETGEISQQSYEELNQLGLSKEIVDGYIEGQKALADNDVRVIYNEVGGEQNYSKLLEWSSQNLTDAEKTAFNDMLDTGTLEQVKLAVSAIANRAGISGDRPQMLEGDTTASVPEVFESVAQVTQAMNDPRYDKDPAYRKKIEDKIARSSVL